MIPIVFGKKSREEMQGACAITCPGCGIVTIADQFVVTSSLHLYFIPAGYKESARYVCCRLCGTASERPEGCAPAMDAPEEAYMPDPDFIERTNPALAANGPDKVEHVSLPEDVTRLQWALLNTINSGFARQDKDDNINGAMLFIGIPLFVSAIYVMGTAAERTRDNYLITMTIMVVYCLVVFAPLGYLHGVLINRGVRRYVSHYIRNYLDLTETPVRSLYDAATALGDDYKKARRHIRKNATYYS